MGDTNGRVVAGGNDRGDRLDQLYCPSDVLIDKETDSLIICNTGRVVRWSRRSGTTQGEILIDNIKCWGLTMDDQRYLYISDTDKHEVRRYQIGDKNGTLVAGGNGKGAGLNQLNDPYYIFVDQQQTVYVSDRDNHRVMKWNKDAKEGIVVAGGQGQGNAVTQLSNPRGLFVDTLGTIYVADSGNNRVMRWPKGAKQGTVILGGNGCSKTMQLLVEHEQFAKMFINEYTEISYVNIFMVQHPSHTLLQQNGFTQQVYLKYKQECLDDKKETLIVEKKKRLLGQYIFTIFREKQATVRVKLGPGQSMEMNTLYRF
ncbi:unnamed protein product [Rotaria sordida]|uniref:Uncharacterized protein n=1 Tax=Rotaria sordida TaxID=392033 RepID=A0A815KMG7_9BILA|nr:unnamed protein product [Rotaria sordida]CAF1621086.1 unnamed protein product [Rotaria sordida]